MIDPHVHLRDWQEAYKETVKHGLSVAFRAGLDAVFDMPNTKPTLTHKDTIEKRLELADRSTTELGISIFYGLFAGITDNPKQIEHVVSVHSSLFPRVVGLKMFACHSTGNMGIIHPQRQREIYRLLSRFGYRGVLAVHAEKEAYIKTRPDGSPDWDPERAYTHAQARPPEAEIQSVQDQILFAMMEGFEGTLHIVHLSTGGALTQINQAQLRKTVPQLRCRITCGITPHHARLTASKMKTKNGLLFKMNPPLRDRSNQKIVLDALLRGEIDWIETDHAPHTAEDKKMRYSSGIPVLPYYPHFIKFLLASGLPEPSITAVTHDNIEKAFGISIKNTHRKPEYDIAADYEYDPFINID